MSAVREDAYLDLEQALIDRVLKSWAREWNPLAKKIGIAIKARDFDKAHELADKLDLSGVAKRTAKYAETVGMSALLLGASRLADSPKQSKLYKHPPRETLAMAMQHYALMLSRNGTRFLKDQLHRSIHNAQRELALNEVLVSKHGNHDQKSHGNWATGAASPGGKLRVQVFDNADGKQLYLIGGRGKPGTEHFIRMGFTFKGKKAHLESLNLRHRETFSPEVQAQVKEMLFRAVEEATKAGAEYVDLYDADASDHIFNEDHPNHESYKWVVDFLSTDPRLLGGPRRGLQLYSEEEASKPVPIEWYTDRRFHYVEGQHGTRTEGWSSDKVFAAGEVLHLGTQQAARERVGAATSATGFATFGIDTTQGKPSYHNFTVDMRTIDRVGDPTDDVDLSYLQKDKQAALSAKGIYGVAYRNQVEDQGSLSLMIWDPRALRQIKKHGDGTHDEKDHGNRTAQYPSGKAFELTVPMYGSRRNKRVLVVANPDHAALVRNFGKDTEVRWVSLESGDRLVFDAVEAIHEQVRVALRLQDFNIKFATYPDSNAFAFVDELPEGIGSGPVKRVRVEKHGDSHDESSHGNWSRGGAHSADLAKVGGVIPPEKFNVVLNGKTHLEFSFITPDGIAIGSGLDEVPLLHREVATRALHNSTDDKGDTPLHRVIADGHIRLATAKFRDSGVGSELSIELAGRPTAQQLAVLRSLVETLVRKPGFVFNIDVLDPDKYGHGANVAWETVPEVGSWLDVERAINKALNTLLVKQESIEKKVSLVGHKISRLPADYKERLKESPQIRLEIDERTRLRVSGIGDSYLSLGASVHLNRLRNYGFLYEAVQQGVEQYEISAILDNRTSKVCRAMDGKVFNVADGWLQASAVMGTDDPDTLKMIAPWPKQTNEMAEFLHNADAETLVGMGLSVPPYHPLCRTVIVALGTTAEAPSESRDYTPSGYENLFMEATQGVQTLVDALFGTATITEAAQTYGETFPAQTGYAVGLQLGLGGSGL